MPQRVLIVDDDRDIRVLVRTLLEEEGFLVEEAEDGQAGLDAIRASTVALVVLIDGIMPKLNGEEVLQAVEHDPPLATRHAFILLTALRSTVPHHLAGRLNLLLLSKPFDIEKLISVVRTASSQLPVIDP